MRTWMGFDFYSYLAAAKKRAAADDEAGSLTVFSLFVFLMIIMMAGMAVDLMRYENERVGLQNTTDTAVVAASSLTQAADTDEELEALVKDYFAKAGYDPDIVTVDPNIEIPAGAETETVRTVNATVDFNMNTAFMPFLGIDRLPGVVGGGAREGQQLIEIALVLDISGSMGWNQKNQNMRNAAKEFVTTIINNNGANRVLISIIPYNQQVYMSQDLLARLDPSLKNPLTTLDPAPANPNAIASYEYLNPESRCAHFLDEDFTTRRLADAVELDMSGVFAQYDWSYNRPNASGLWCGANADGTSNFPSMLLYQNNETILHNHIDTLGAQGWTAIDYGMNWAVGILDPSFRPVVSGMVTDNLAPATASGHPVDYAEPNVLKYVVLMTDGANTEHRDLEEPFKSGPSRIWYSPSAGATDEFDGFFVEMPDRPADERWYVPRSPWNDNDHDFVANLPADAEQWSYHQVYRRFSVPNVATYFFQDSDTAAYNEHIDAAPNVGGYADADTNLKAICDKAKENAWIEVFTVAFEAPIGGQTVLQDCASEVGNYFDVAGTQISDAFSQIAAEISKLRLTQ